MPVTSTLDFASRPAAKFRNQGLLAARPAPEGIGDTYLATDTGQVFTSIDGINWTLFGGSSALNDLSDVVAATWTKGALLVGHDDVQWSVWGPGQSGYAPIFDSSQSGGLEEYPFKLQHLLDVETGSPADGEVPTWSDSNQRFDWVEPGSGSPSVPAYMGAQGTRITSDESVTAGANIYVHWNSENWDTDAFHDTVTANDLFTIPGSNEEGYYQVTGQVGVFFNDAADEAVVRLFHYDDSLTTHTEIAKILVICSGNSFTIWDTITGFHDADTDDYFYMRVEQPDGGGSALAVKVGSWLEMHRIGI